MPQTNYKTQLKYRVAIYKSRVINSSV